MTIPLRRLFAPTACAAGLVVPLLLAGPAVADTEVKRAPRGDVSEIRGRQQAPQQSADVLQLRSRHADGVLALEVVVAQLDATIVTGVAFAIRTSVGRTLDASVSRDAEGVRSVHLFRRDTGRVRCSGLRGGVRPAADRMTVTVPRTCLGRPRWVRTGALTYATSDEAVLTFNDDARRDGTVRPPYPALGTRRLFLN